MNASIPVYLADGSLYACVSEQRLARLQSAGLVARVGTPSQGPHQPGHSLHPAWRAEAAVSEFRHGHQIQLQIVSGTRAGVETETAERQLRREDVRAELKRLNGNCDGKTYAPPETRARRHRSMGNLEFSVDE